MSKNEKIVGVILAAGKGTRMEPFSTHYPKPILPVCNKPLLRYLIEMMKEMGIDEIVIVIGHLGYEIAQAIGDGSDLGVKIKYVEQDKTLGIAHAVGKLEPHISSSMLLLLGDIFCAHTGLENMAKMMAEHNAGAVLAVKKEDNIEAIKRNFTVILNNDNKVSRVIEKPQHLTTNMKGVGIYLFSQHVFDAIRRTPRTAMRDEYEITDTIQIMVDDGLPVCAAEVIKWDINVSFPPDVLECNLRQMKILGVENLFANNIKVAPGANIKNTVLGEGVIIQNPISITNTVIFPNTVVTSKGDMDRLVITPENRIDCKNFMLNTERTYV